MNTKSKESGDTELGSLRKRVNSLSNLLKTQEKEFESTRRQIDATENLYIDLCVEIGDILFYLDEDNRFLDIQAKPGVPLFQQPQEFIGKKIEDVIPSDVAEKYFSALEKLTPGNPQTFQYSLSINGNLYSFMATLNRSAIDNKTVAKIRNITRYKNVEKELQRETTLFEILFNNSPESIVLTEKDGSVLRVNKEFENMFGFNRNEVRGENIDRLIAPEELLSEAQQITSQIVQNKKIHEEAKRRRKDGSTLFVSILGATVDIEEENKIVFCIYRDITKRKKAEIELKKKEMLYRTVIENTGTATLIVEKDNIISFANHKFEELSGYSKDGIEGIKNISDFIAEDQLQKHNLYLDNINQETPSTPCFQFETNLKSKNKEIKNLLVSFASIPGTDRFVVSMIDLTDKRKLEQELRQSQKLESVGNLAAGVAHDFNNILTVIQVNNEMAELQTSNNSPLQENLENINNACTRASHLTEQLLFFSRKHKMQKVAIDLNQCINNLLKMVKRIIGEDIVVETNLEQELWTLEGDQNNIEQVLMNLVVNAREAMPEGGEITITTENIRISKENVHNTNESEPGDYVRLMIEDTGSGIKSDIQGHVFDPFFTTKDNNKGTGLGLSVVYGIVKKHKGWINLDSEIDVGTKFTLYFPRITMAEKNNNEKEKEIKDLQGKGEHVLLVEDDPTVLEIGKEVLEFNGYRVSTAQRASEAKKIFRNRKDEIDLVISDVVLPDINGVKLIKQLQAMREDLPAILSSGYTDEKSRRSIIDEMGLTFIQKPFTTKEILSGIKETLNRV